MTAKYKKLLSFVVQHLKNEINEFYRFYRYEIPSEIKDRVVSDRGYSGNLGNGVGDRSKVDVLNSKSRKILDYVSDNGECSVIEIGDNLSISHEDAQFESTRLINAGLLEVERQKTKTVVSIGEEFLETSIAEDIGVCAK